MIGKVRFKYIFISIQFNMVISLELTYLEALTALGGLTLLPCLHRLSLKVQQQQVGGVRFKPTSSVLGQAPGYHISIVPVITSSSQGLSFNHLKAKDPLRKVVGKKVPIGEYGNGSQDCCWQSSHAKSVCGYNQHLRGLQRTAKVLPSGLFSQVVI